MVPSLSSRLDDSSVATALMIGVLLNSTVSAVLAHLRREPAMCSHSDERWNINPLCEAPPAISALDNASTFFTMRVMTATSVQSSPSSSKHWDTRGRHSSNMWIHKQVRQQARCASLSSPSRTPHTSVGDQSRYASAARDSRAKHSAVLPTGCPSARKDCKCPATNHQVMRLSCSSSVL